MQKLIRLFKDHCLFFIFDSEINLEKLSFSLTESSCYAQTEL